jgi:hypothetical protein
MVSHGDVTRLLPQPLCRRTACLRAAPSSHLHPRVPEPRSLPEPGVFPRRHSLWVRPGHSQTFACLCPWIDPLPQSCRRRRELWANIRPPRSGEQYQISQSPLSVRNARTDDPALHRPVTHPCRAATITHTGRGGSSRWFGHATEFSRSAGTSGRSRAMKWPAPGTWVNSALGNCRLLACRSEGRDQSFSP